MRLKFPFKLPKAYKREVHNAVSESYWRGQRKIVRQCMRDPKLRKLMAEIFGQKPGTPSGGGSSS